jgi:hypothetical protein
MATTGLTALEKTLIGVEAAAGASTDVVTTHWRGVGKVKDRREVVFPPERVGKIGGTNRSYIPVKGCDVMLEGDAKFSQLAYIKNAGIYLTTPTTDATSGFIRTWTVQASSSDAISTTDLGTLVVESGDNIEVQLARFCFVREYTETGRQGEALQISATLQGRDPSTGTFTAVGTTDFDNDAEAILCSNVYLYFDPSSDTPGTTQKTATYLEHTLTHKTGWVALEAKDGRLDFSDIKHIDDEITLDVTFEHNGVAIAQKDAWKNQTEQVLRLKFLGSALTTTDAGATYDTKAYVMDLYGKWQTFGAEGLEEQNGDNIYRGTFRAAWSSIANNKAVFVLVTEQATLP